MTGLLTEPRVHEPGSVVRLRKGLDISIAGAPHQAIEQGRRTGSVALVGDDYVGLRPKLLVQRGDRVRLGQPLFADRRDARIVFTAPGSGRVTAVNLGERRMLRSLVISIEGDGDQETFPTHVPGSSREAVIEILLRSGLWTALRTRPFGRVPLPDSVPRAIFITAIDTNPLAARPEVVLAEHEEDFASGIAIVGRLAECPVYLCMSPGPAMGHDYGRRVTRVCFSGPHPAGLPGTHIHFLSPAGIGHEVWHIGYQDVIAIGRLFATGRLSTERVIALAGPAVRRPRLVRTRLGADLSELVEGEVADGPTKIMSGPPLAGRRAEPPTGYIGRYHVQVIVLRESPPCERSLRSWLSELGFGRETFPRPSASHLADGEAAAVVPLEILERVMPLDILPAPLLRALAAGDTERALDLGCLELEEEDLALCSFVCPAGLDYGALLRRTLMQLEKEL
ncbi:Na(+)-translocating NADH-quinone reductase subunit A [Rhizobium aegyptiacum]|uniref:Na(+)-translocating NADH-quinone reductase subunit A n=1 Tax=Rhizobium aegyptiacum TaxID=1764550 RepID=UPI0007E53479|nr:Na(+)-translocating NADH-quinone reductase subunit A [Rhizobium aegyptiacum]